MPASPGDAQKKSSLDASVPFLTAPAKENDGAKLFPYNSRIVRLKDEDRFQVCLDLRLKKRRKRNRTEPRSKNRRRDGTICSVRRTYNVISGEVRGEALAEVRV